MNANHATQSPCLQQEKPPLSFSLPKTVIAELTYACNHRCSFCACAWDKPHDPSEKLPELSTSEWEETLTILKSRGVRHVTFSGGEALLREDIFELISFAHSLNMSVGLISNGRALDEQKLDRLKELDVQLSISVPGINTFKRHTGVDNIDHVFALFEYARSIDLFVCANVTVTSINIDELYETVALPLIHGADYILLNRFLPGGRGLGHEELIIDKEQTNQMLQITEEVLSRANREGHVGTEIPYCIIDNPDQYHHLKISNSCGAAQGFFVVDPSGYIKVCNISDQRLVHVRDIDKLTEHTYWQMFKRRTYLPEPCQDCKQNSWCVGGCRESARLYTGDIRTFDPCLGTPEPIC